LRTYASCPSLLARWRASSQPQCAALAAKFRHNSAKPNPSPPKREAKLYSAVAGSRWRPPKPSNRGVKQLDWTLPRRGGAGDRANSLGTAATPAGGAAARYRGLRQAPAPAAPYAARTLELPLRRARCRRREGARPATELGVSLSSASVSPRSSLVPVAWFGLCLQAGSNRQAGPIVSHGVGFLATAEAWGRRTKWPYRAVAKT
jgi:hypothetical protein